MIAKVQVFVNGRYIHRGRLEELTRSALELMLRGVMRSIEPEGKYRLDITEEET